jgi:hypothetical protein
MNVTWPCNNKNNFSDKNVKTKYRKVLYIVSEFCGHSYVTILTKGKISM